MNKPNETVYLYVRDTKNKNTWPKFDDKPATSAMEKWLQRNLNKSYQKYVVYNEFYKIAIQRFEKRNHSDSNTVFKAKLFHKDIPDYVTVDLRMDDFFDIVEKCGMTNSFEIEDENTSFFIYKNHNSYGITYRGSEKEKDCIMEESSKQAKVQTAVTIPVPFTVYNNYSVGDVLYLGKSSNKEHIFAKINKRYDFMNQQNRIEIIFFNSKKRIPKLHNTQLQNDRGTFNSSIQSGTYKTYNLSYHEENGTVDLKDFGI